MAIIKTISIEQRHEQFLKENPQLKPSKIMQQAIEALMNDYNQTDLSGLLQIQKSRNAQLMETITRMNRFLEKRELLESFFNDEATKDNP